MVTGAGGSIGSEICRQVAEHGAKEIIAYERHENSMYALGIEFAQNVHSGAFRPVVGDIHDNLRLEETLKLYQPDIIFHTAAYKHVPLMENNVMEAVRNNYIGTRNVALQAAKHGVGTFVFISTDKAVNPTNIMGATKRACELLVGALAKDSRCTRYLTVRFGNVLGSSGSVVPLFREQIVKGGPVTVTHPDITRFLMLIPEAVLLVLEAASVGKGGETFVLDMGEPIKIVDLARNLIILSGYEPDKDIKIEFVGLRPGEKLYEELFDKSEKVTETQLEKINRAVSSQSPDKDTVLRLAEEFEGYLKVRDKSGVLRTLRSLVTSYRPSIADECATDLGLTGSD
jgi:FlaA1/EpsC-like NDP-sugar epimerase